MVPTAEPGNGERLVHRGRGHGSPADAFGDTFLELGGGKRISRHPGELPRPMRKKGITFAFAVD